MKNATKGIFDFCMPLRSSLACLLVLISLVTGCSYISMPSLPWSKRAVDPNPTADKLFEEGTTLLKNKKYYLAIDRFKQLQSEFPFAPQLIQAELKLGEAYYLNKQYPEAIAAFKDFKAMHPNNENLPFAVYHLGLAHLDQFTNVDRDQKMTTTAKDYFETVVKNYPGSPYARQSKEKLAQCVAYLAQHEFNIATFYMREKNYPAARERLEEILRRYPDSPVAAQSLYSLGESYRLDKNTLKATLAYEALIQHYPESQLAKQARVQMAQLDQEKQDPLALLLMRDRRPTFAAAQIRPGGETQVASAGPQDSKAETPDRKDLNLVAKTEVVYEEPGSEKGIFRRVVDTLNPFSSSSSSSSSPPNKANGADKPEAAKEQSTGFFASLWGGINPFSKKNQNEEKTKTAVAGDPRLVEKIDQSLEQKGIDTGSQNSASRPPAADLANVAAEAAPPRVDASELLRNIDANLKKEGKNVSEMPTPPEPDPAFSGSGPVAQKTATPKAGPVSTTATSGLITNIDERLKAKGIDPSKVQLASPGGETVTYRPEFEGSSSPQAQGKIELAPRIAVEKGPLFLDSGKVREEDLGKGDEEKEKIQSQKTTEPIKELPQAVVKGRPAPAQEKVAETKPADKKTTGGADEESKGVLDQIKEDLGRMQSILNPFSW